MDENSMTPRMEMLLDADLLMTSEVELVGMWEQGWNSVLVIFRWIDPNEGVEVVDGLTAPQGA